MHCNATSGGARKAAWVNKSNLFDFCKCKAKWPLSADMAQRVQAVGAQNPLGMHKC